jgi:hypothetical protein
MRGVQIVSLKSVQGLKAHLSLPQTALNFELLPAVLRRALVRRSRTRRTARVPWLIPVQLTSRCGHGGERWLRLTAPPFGLFLPLWGPIGTVLAHSRLTA